VLADAVGLSTFTVIGCSFSLKCGEGRLISVLMGVITGSFGGIVRDILCGSVPLVLRREIYATAAILGGAVFVAMLASGAGEKWSMLFGASVVWHQGYPAYCSGWLCQFLILVNWRENIMNRYRVLLLGLGFWGTRWMRVISEIDQCDLVGISGAEQDVARLRGDYDLSGVGVFADFREAIGQVDADIAVIAIPTLFHVEAARRALDRGMHVLSEKPLASNVEEARMILDYKRRYPSLCYMIDQNYRWRQHNQTMKKTVESGLIGEVGSVHIEFRQMEDLLGYREFLNMPLLQDVSIHHFDLIRFFTGVDCRSIYAHSYRPAWSKFDGRPGTEAVLRMDDGIVVNYNATWAARGRQTSWDGDITITGDKGCITLDAADNVRLFANSDTTGRLLDKVDMPATELGYALSMMVGCIENGSIPETTIEDNIRSYAMVCAAEESVALDQPVALF